MNSNLLRAALGLSDLDRAIIYELQTDGRRPFARIAASVGASEKTVRSRVRSLRDDGVIEITAVTDPEHLGYGASALLALNLERTPPAPAVAQELIDIPAVDHVTVTTGRYDIFVEVLCKNRAELLHRIDAEIKPAAGVRKLEVFPYIRLHYQEPRWEAARWKSGTAGIGKIFDLDDVDRGILAELNEDGRRPFQQVASALQISESQVRQRLARMIGSGVARIMALANPRSLGFQMIAWLGVIAAPGACVADLAGEIAGLTSIAYVAVCAGRFDIFAEAICLDEEDLLRVLDTEVRPLPGVARVELFVYLDLYYKRLPPLRPVIAADHAP